MIDTATTLGRAPDGGNARRRGAATPSEIDPVQILTPGTSSWFDARRGRLLAFAGNAPLPITIPPLGMAPFFGLTWDVTAVAYGGAGPLHANALGILTDDELLAEDNFHLGFTYLNSQDSDIEGYKLNFGFDF